MLCENLSLDFDIGQAAGQTGYAFPDGAETKGLVAQATLNRRRPNDGSPARSLRPERAVQPQKVL